MRFASLAYFDVDSFVFHFRFVQVIQGILRTLLALKRDEPESPALFREGLSDNAYFNYLSVLFEFLFQIFVVYFPRKVAHVQHVSHVLSGVIATCFLPVARPRRTRVPSVVPLALPFVAVVEVAAIRARTTATGRVAAREAATAAVGVGRPVLTR